MCTSFVYRKNCVWVGMNFDNDGKEFTISTNQGGDFLVSVKFNGISFPSFGINRNGIFVNDLMVDSNGAGKYKRQTNKRWVTTSLVKYVMDEQVSFEDVKNVLQQVEIVNAPNQSTHNLIVDRSGKICLVEPGRRNVYTEHQDSDWYVMTNFPLSDYEEIVPYSVSGSGTDRYLKALGELTSLNKPMRIGDGFEILKGVIQTGPVWTTELSLLYSGEKRELYYCLDQHFDAIVQFDFGSQTVINKTHVTRT